MAVLRLEAAGDGRYVQEEVGLHHYESRPYRLVLHVVVEQVQLHPLAQYLPEILVLCVVYGDVSAVCGLGLYRLVVPLADDTVQVAGVYRCQLYFGCRVVGYESCQPVRHVGLEHGRHEPREHADVLQPLFAVGHVGMVRPSAHLLHRHPFLRLQPAVLAEVVHLRKKIAEARACRLQSLGAAQYQCLVHKAVCRNAGFTRCQLHTPSEQFVCTHCFNNFSAKV